MIVRPVDVTTGGSRFSPGASVRSFFYSTDDRPHVLMVSHHCCIRVIKQALALKARGWRVDSLSVSAPGVKAFDAVIVAPEQAFPDLIAASGASIIHVHNEPDMLMRYADTGARGRPVVYDCHDLEYHRFGAVTEDELFAFNRADGIIHVSASYRDCAAALHSWRCPDAVTRSLPLRSEIPIPPTHRRRAVVYEGGTSSEGGYGWRDHSRPARVFAEAGIDFDIYTRHDPGYGNVMGYLPYDELMKAVSGYEFGFCGSDPGHPKTSIGMPNKLNEYAACGVIPLILNAPCAAAEFGSGIVASSTEEAIERMRACDVDAMRADVYAHARYMDDEIEATIGLYGRLL